MSVEREYHDDRGKLVLVFDCGCEVLLSTRMSRGLIKICDRHSRRAFQNEVDELMQDARVAHHEKLDAIDGGDLNSDATTDANSAPHSESN